jgi:predicted GNAT family acetyltransferase
MEASDDPVRVVLNAGAKRYELWSGDELAGFASFRTGPGWIRIFHAEVQPAFEGHGLGSRLAAGALDDVRSQGIGVIPACPFIANYVHDHSEYADLVRG